MDTSITFTRLKEARTILDVAFNLYTTDPNECSSLSKVANNILAKVIENLDSVSASAKEATEAPHLATPPLPISGASSTSPMEEGQVEDQDQGQGQEQLQGQSQASICPPQEIHALDSDTVTTATAKRNFSTWAKMLNIQSGHTLYHNTTHYTLSFEKGRACLTTTTSAGKKITGHSPSGAIKAYLKANGSTQQVDGWKKLSMYNEEGRLLPICWTGWLLRQWSPSIKTFQVMDSV
jgi:hypothetical protein